MLHLKTSKIFIWVEYFHANKTVRILFDNNWELTKSCKILKISTYLTQKNVFPTWFNIMGSVCFYSFRTTNGLDQFRWKHKNNFFDTLISFSPTFLGLALRWQDWEIYFEGLRVKPHSAENFGDKVKLCRCFQQTCNSSRKSRRSKGHQRSNLTPSPKFCWAHNHNFFCMF